MKHNNLYKYFDRHRGQMRKLMDKHKIDKAIRSAIGERQFDKRIRAIWDRVLKRPVSEDGKETAPYADIQRCTSVSEDTG